MELQDVVVSQPRRDAAVVELKGEHDLATRRELLALLHGLVLTNDLVVVDLSPAQFVDSTVLATLLQVTALAGREETTFRLQVGTTAIVRRALEVSRILASVEHASSREEALRQSRVPRVA